jgi:hypothetical protein
MTHATIFSTIVSKNFMIEHEFEMNMCIRWTKLYRSHKEYYPNAIRRTVYVVCPNLTSDNIKIIKAKIELKKKQLYCS